MNFGRIHQQRSVAVYVSLALGATAALAASSPVADVVGPNDVRQLAPLGRPVAGVAPAGARVAGGPIPHSIGGDPTLLSSGTFVTHPGGGAGGADGSRLQDTSLLMTIFGFGHDILDNIRLADDFEVPDGETWIVSSVSFFAYQTGSSTTSTIDNVHLQIWDGPPNDPLSTVVFGDIVTNRLAQSVWSNAYRELESAPGNNQRPIMEDVVTAAVNLPSGVYWLDWQTGGTLASGPWAPPITITGQTVTGDALQFIGGTWGAATDVGAQGFPFIIRGFVDRLPFIADFEEGDLSEWDFTGTEP